MNLLVTQERFERVVTGRDVIGISEKNLKQIYELMSKFAVEKNGQYIEKEKAFEELVDLPMSELRELQEKFWDEFNKVAVNPPKGTA